MVLNQEIRVEPRLVVPMYAISVHRDFFIYIKGGNNMDFTMIIPASEFKDFQLKVVSLAPIKVTVIGHEDEEL